MALDWTPNVNHVGFFVAQEKGFYADEEIDLTITSPLTDGYALTTSSQAARRLITLTTSRRCGGSTGSVLSSYNRIKRCTRSDTLEPSRSTSVQGL